jgi:DNA-binding NarL/FixJ family response regulator
MELREQDFPLAIAGGCNTNQLRAERATRLLSKLTPRQLHVLRGMADGLLNKQIAAFLQIDEKTVKMHRANVLRRLGVNHSARAIRIAVEASFAAEAVASGH